MNTDGAVTDGQEQVVDIEDAMLDAGQMARLLKCSQRSVYRLTSMGRIPKPVRLGALVRWSRDSISRWIEEGCPS